MFRGFDCACETQVLSYAHSQTMHILAHAQYKWPLKLCGALQLISGPVVPNRVFHSISILKVQYFYKNKIYSYFWLNFYFVLEIYNVNFQKIFANQANSRNCNGFFKFWEGGFIYKREIFQFGGQKYVRGREGALQQDPVLVLPPLSIYLCASSSGGRAVQCSVVYSSYQDIEILTSPGLN